METSETTGCNLELRLFGPFDARVGGQPLPPLRTRKGQWLLALLALRHGKEVSREWLAGTLWPDSLESQSLGNLRKALTDLRSALGPEADRIESPSLLRLYLNLNGAFLDIKEFDSAIGSGDMDRLEQAVGLVHGRLLEGCDEDWALEERNIREQSLLRALEMLADHAYTSENMARAADWLRRIVSIEPLREEAQRRLMEALAANGEFAALTNVYRDLRLYLHREHNAEPDAQTAALYRQLQKKAAVRPDVAPRAATVAPAPLPVRPLPRALTQLVGRDREAFDVIQRLDTARLVTLTGAGGVGKTRLSLRVAESCLQEYPDGAWFVDLAAIQDPAFVMQRTAETFCVPEGNASLLSTALTNHLQERSLLLILDNCEHVLSACAAVADVVLRGCPHIRILTTSRQPLGLTGEAVYRVPSLSLPRINDIDGTTSREPDAVDLQTRSGSTNGPGILESEALRLFVDRVRDSSPKFELNSSNIRAAAGICVCLDGIPLALELAAARIRSLSLQQILKRLDDRFRLLSTGDRTLMPRQQTLQALIDWSYDLLSEPEKLLLQRLSIFAGGWTLEAAEEICARVSHVRGGDNRESSLGQGEPGIDSQEILDLLSLLVDKSLVVYSTGEEEGRYSLLETMRQYAANKLGTGDHALNLHARHAEHYLALARDAEAYLQRPEQAEWLTQLATEHDNMRAALAFCLPHTNKGGDAARLAGRSGQNENSDLGADSDTQASRARLGLELCVALWWFWDVRGFLREGREWLERALAVNPEPTELRAQALIGLGTLARLLSDTDEAARLYRESLQINSALSNQRGVGGSLISLGIMALSGADYARAHVWFTQAAEVWEQLGDAEQLALVWNNLGFVAQMQGESAEAQRRYEASLAIHRKSGDKRSMAVGLYNLAELALDEENADSAAAHLNECVDISVEIGDRYLITHALRGAAALAGLDSKWHDAVELWSVSESLREELEAPLEHANQVSLDRGIGMAKSAIAEQEFQSCWTSGQQFSLDEAVQRARAVLIK